MSILGSIIGAKAGNKGAKKSAKYQVEVAKMNNDLAQKFRDENTQNLSPFMNRGNVAGAYYNALLGLPGAEYTTQVAGPTQPAAQPSAQHGGLVGSVMESGHLFNKQLPTASAQQPMQSVTTQVNPVSAQNAFDTYQNSTGYQFRLGQGMNALNNGYAAQGALRSGKAQKDFMRFGQGIASDEFGRYMNYLGNQQGVGMQGAGAIAGVGLNTLNAMSGNNQNAADARSNAALIKANNNQQMWSQIDQQLSNVASSFGGA